MTINSLDNDTYVNIHDSPLCIIKLVTEDTWIDSMLYKTVVGDGSICFGGSVDKGFAISPEFLTFFDIYDGIGYTIHEYYTSPHGFKQNILMTVSYLDI